MSKTSPDYGGKSQVLSKALAASFTTLRRCGVHKGCVTKAESSRVEDSDILELNTKGLYTKIGDGEVG